MVSEYPKFRPGKQPAELAKELKEARKLNRFYRNNITRCRATIEDLRDKLYACKEEKALVLSFQEDEKESSDMRELGKATEEAFLRRLGFGKGHEKDAREVVWEYSIVPVGWKRIKREYCQLEAAKKEQAELDQLGIESKRIKGIRSEIGIIVEEWDYDFAISYVRGKEEG